MENACELHFERPSFFKRIKGMLGVDFYRLFHTPLLYIFLGIAAIIPALVSMGATGGGETAGMFSNAWQIVAANGPLYVVSDIGEYANMNMVFIFGGIMISIFIGHDYKSGYVKQLFTTHAKKQDYMIGKSLAGAFSMACMCIMYLIGGIASGTVYGLVVRNKRRIARVRDTRQNDNELGLGKPVHVYKYHIPIQVRYIHSAVFCARNGHSRYRRGGGDRQHARAQHISLRIICLRLPYKQCAFRIYLSYELGRVGGRV